MCVCVWACVWACVCVYVCVGVSGMDISLGRNSSGLSWCVCVCCVCVGMCMCVCGWVDMLKSSTHDLIRINNIRSPMQCLVEQESRRHMERSTRDGQYLHVLHNHTCTSVN